MWSNEIVNQWVTGLFVSLVIGSIVTRLFLHIVRKRIGYVKPNYALVPYWVLGLVEGVFFTVAVAFNLPGVVIAMIAWMVAKMAAHWGSAESEVQPNIAAVRFSALLGSMISLFFAMIGGLICSGRIWIEM